ncbi:hypothetical protein, partial [Campylobacter sp.]|uniref:hypothetical protein n=2 Tax=Campylobacter sp. TaxID=205 RepID=UPI002AA917FF
RTAQGQAELPADLFRAEVYCEFKGIKMLIIQLDNNLMSSDIIKAIKAILKTQPKNYYSISKSLVDEVSELEREYKKGKIKGYKSAEDMHKAIFDE